MRIVRLVLTAALVLALASCEFLSPLGIFNPNPDDDQGILVPDLPTFDVEMFENLLEADLGTDWMGYAYAVNLDGQLVGSGIYGDWVFNDTDADLTTPVYGASVEKYMSAVAVMRLLEQNPGVDLDDGIVGYLPPSWEGNGWSTFIQGVTIRELLTHQTGIPGAANDYTASYGTLKDLAQTGLDPGDTAAIGRNYSNANYGFIRMFIATMNGASYFGDDAQMEGAAINQYLDYMDDHILGPAGVTLSATPSRVLYYEAGETSGWTIGNRGEWHASGAYYYSALDLARFAAYVNNTETIISEDSRAELNTNLFGLDWSNPNGQRGAYYTKGGSLNDGTGRGMRAVLAILADDIEVVFITNTRSGALDSGTAIRQAILDAYHASWN